MSSRKELFFSSENTDPQVLKKSWRELIAQLSTNFDLQVADNVFELLARAYTDPTRYHHSLRHIEDMLEFASVFAKHLKDSKSVIIAIWFHDLAYDTKSNTNEEDSAQLAFEMLTELKIPSDIIAKVVTYILATKEHSLDIKSSNEGLAYFLDFDMAILGASAERYDRYASDIAQEFAWAMDFEGKDVFTPARIQFIQHTLQRPIFKTQVMSEFETQARFNLSRELERLMKSKST